MPDKHKLPNILIIGTPGTGKTTLAAEVVEATAGLEHVNVGELAAQHELYEGYDEEFGCHVLDEEKLLDWMEERMNSEEGGVVVDYHGCDFFPERWFDAVFVLRTDNTVLFDRLEARGYGEKKLRQNVECEIFGTLLEEAREAYQAEIVHEIRSDNTDDMEKNVESIKQWIQNWMQDHESGME